MSFLLTLQTEKASPNVLSCLDIFLLREKEHFLAKTLLFLAQALQGIALLESGRLTSYDTGHDLVWLVPRALPPLSLSSPTPSPFVLTYILLRLPFLMAIRWLWQLGPSHPVAIFRGR